MTKAAGPATVRVDMARNNEIPTVPPSIWNHSDEELAVQVFERAINTLGEGRARRIQLAVKLGLITHEGVWAEGA